MSVEFSNVYQEILLENLMSVIKQNFLFQTQLKVAESSNKNNADLKKQFDELTVLYNNAKSQLGQLEVYKTKAESNTSAHEEKSRIQSALNDSMKKNSNLQKELEIKQNEIVKLDEVRKQELKNLQIQIDSLNSYILKLEEIVPVNKLKKVKAEKSISFEQKEEVVLPVFEEKNDTPKIENKIQKVLDDSAF